MQITLTKEQVREAFGELRYMGADYCYKYDKETRKKTEEVEALKLHLGSMKLGNSVDIRLEATELPKVEPYTVVELEEAVYAPYVQRGNFPVLVEKITCKGIRPVPGNSLRTAPYSVKGAKGVEEVPGTWRKPRHTTKGRDDDNRGNENFRTPLY